MSTFLFWNMRGRDLRTQIGRLAQSHGVDTFILVEFPSRLDTILSELSSVTGTQYRIEPAPGCKRVRFITRLPNGRVWAIGGDERFSTYCIDDASGIEYIVACAHLIMKGHSSPDSQRSCANDLACLVEDAEKQRHHFRTVVVGDMNMNTFDVGIVSCDGLHAVMDRRIASGRTRTINRKKSRRMLFNPMWEHWGNAQASPPGTFYFRTNETDCLFWHMIDQVLIRPELFPYFVTEDLKILTTDGHHSLCTDKGIPRRGDVSDHLPILFRMAF